MSDATSLPDLGFLIGPEDDYVPPEAPAFDVEDALGADDDGAWPEITVPGGAFGEPSVWEEAPASFPDGLIGYVTACPAHLPHPDVAPGDGEVQRLYILRGHQGGGRGTLLLRTALEWLERDGPRTLWIGVWSENYGAQRFYARHGFEIVGE